MELNELIKGIGENKTTVFEVVEAVEGQGKQLSIVQTTVKPDPQEPVEAWLNNRAHVFNDVEGLAAYLNKYKTEFTVVLGDVERLEASVSLNDTNGAGGYEVVTYKPVFHPAFATWMKIVGQTIPVLDFAQFVMENRRFIESGRSMALLFSQIRASKQIEIAQGRGKKSINGLMVTIEIAGTKTEEFQELPEMLEINVPVFLQSPVSRVELDLLVSEKNEEIFVTVSAGDIKSVQADQFIADINELGSLVENINCTFGKIAFKPREFLKA